MITYPILHQWDSPNNPLDLMLRDAAASTTTTTGPRPHDYAERLHGALMMIPVRTWESEYVAWLANQWLGGHYIVLDSRLK